MDWGHISSEHSWCFSAAGLSGEELSTALAYQEGTLLKGIGTELRIQVIKGTYPCEISSAASRGENCPHKAKDSTEEKGNSTAERTRSLGSSCADSSMVLLLSLSLDKTRFYQS